MRKSVWILLCLLILLGCMTSDMPTIFKLEAEHTSTTDKAIICAADILTAGGLALVPTETVYGVAASVAAFSDDAAYERDATTCVNGAPVPALGTGYRRIFTLKRRDIAQTVAWLVAGTDDLDRFGVNVDPRARVLAREFWPGALTIVVKAAPSVPRFMQETDGTVALRASASSVIASLIKACKSPLACTSSNTHGAPAPASFDQVEARVLDGVDVAIDAGETKCLEASTIVSFESGELSIIREGALPSSQIINALECASSSLDGKD